MIDPIIITDASTEPITLAELKEHTRIDTTTTAQDTMLEDIYIPAARIEFERLTGRTVHQKTIEWIFARFPPTPYPLVLQQATPLLSIASVKYKDSDGTETTWGSSNYIADTDSVVGKVFPAYGVQWPSFTPYPVNPIRVRGNAGILTASPVTEASPMIKYVISAMVAGMWLWRESELLPERRVGDMLEKNPHVASMLQTLTVRYGFGQSSAR